MTWIKFALWITVIYTVYYGVILLIDFMRNRHKQAGNDVPELTFVEDIAPVRVDLPKTEGEQHPVSAVIASGGVVLKQMFGLAREEAVEFTRAVSF